MARKPTPPTPEDRAAVRGAGLCAGCGHLEVLRSPRSTFVRCALADREPTFPRYPLLPVRACAGFVAAPTPRRAVEDPGD